jgi:hypothetical protein
MSRVPFFCPFQPESIGYRHPIEAIKPLAQSRLVFQKKTFPTSFDPDPAALELIKDIYFQLGYERKQIPFFDSTGHCKL